jgi:hypothetical protein
VSANDILTLAVAAAAVAVPLVALFISNHADRRAARSALTDLSLKISERTAAYDDLDANNRFAPSREIEMLVLQAEYLMQSLTTRRRVLFPESSVATTLAMALDKINDFWWSDKHWQKAAETADAYFRVLICSYWGAALIRRRALTQGRDIVDKALEKLPTDAADTSNATETCIIRGDICLSMAESDNAEAGKWLARAKTEYGNIPQDDDRYMAYVPGGNAWLNLNGRALSGANLTSADLTGAGLTSADLSNAGLAGADLSNANLTGADLTSADLTSADLSKADLTDANLTDADLTGVELTGAILSETAACPDGWMRDPDSGRLERVSPPPT